MRLCFLGSAESIHAYRWVTFFANRGHETHWLSFAPSSFGDLGSIHFQEIRRSSNTAFGLLGAVRRTRQVIQSLRPDILHAHYLGAYGLLGALSGVHPFVATAWGSDILFAGKSPVKRPFVKFVLRSADVITCDAEHMIRAIGTFGINESEVRLIYFGVDTERFRPAPPSQELRRRLGLEGSPSVISLRRLEPVYDVETLLRAAPLVLQQIPDAKFVVVGSGSQEGALKGLAKSLGLGPSVIFAGSIQNHELPAYLTSVEVYVSTSLSDAGLSASTAEAMACGLPVVISNTGENEKWVQSGRTGYLTPAGDPVALAERLALLLRDPTLRDAMGRAGREVIKQRNDFFVEMEKVEGIYEDLAQAGRG
jgi:glycosyltransferase involved in cell wall biosynthesis